MRSADFIEMVKKDCRHHKIEFRSTEGETIDCSGCETCGFFNEKTLGIAWGMGPRRAFEVLVHEYNHMQQFLDKDPLWIPGKTSPFHEWMVKRKRIAPKRLKYEYARDALLEWDCERRTLEMMDAFDLPTNAQHYAQVANSYIWTYAWILKHRAWPDISADAYAQIMQHVPMRLVSRRAALRPPKIVRDLMDKYLEAE